MEMLYYLINQIFNMKNTGLEIFNQPIIEGDIFDITETPNGEVTEKTKFRRIVKQNAGEWYLVDNSGYGEPLKLAIDLESDYCGIFKFMESHSFKYQKVGNVAIF